MFHQGIVIIVTYKMSQTFLLKRKIKALYKNQILSFKRLYNGKDLTVLLKMGLSRDINKLSLIRKLVLLESLDKMVKSLKFILQSQVSK